MQITELSRGTRTRSFTKYMENLESPPVVSQDNNSLESHEGFGKDEILAEVKKQLRLAGPLVSINFLLFDLQLISVMFVGHLGNLALSGASMATSFASVTGFSLLGMASALDTFCGQSYGAKQHHMLGVHLQTALIVLLSASVPLALIWANAGSILLFFGQDPEISAEDGRYARFMLPSIFGFAIQECHIRFLQAQNNLVPMMVISGFTTLLHIIVCWILVFKSGLGNKGAALANAVSYWTNAVVLTLLEVWSFEMMVLLSGRLPNPKLETSVMAISLNTCSTIYMIPLGLSAAVSTRSSNELGAGRPLAAYLAVCVTVVSEGIAAGTVMISGRKIWGHLYSQDEQVVKYVGQMLPPILLMVSNLCLQGLWTCIIVALTVQALCLTLRTKWEEEAMKAVNRATNSWGAMLS